MSFDALIRQGLQLADSLTGSLQDTVMYEPWQGENRFGEPVYGQAHSIKALVERDAGLKHQYVGLEFKFKHLIYILRPMPPDGSEGRNEPIDSRDRFTLSDGSTTKTAKVSGLMDPQIAAGYYHIVALGD